MKKLVLPLLPTLAILIWIGCDVVNPPIYGCLDPLADNYSEEATLADGPCLGKCNYDSSEAILGCTDPTALNYNPIATSNNCDCIFEGQRNVLLEDYTGHTCGNCPRAAETLKDLEQTHGSKIIPIAVHVGFFAEPRPNDPDGKYVYDFRTEVGNAYNDEFNNASAGLPNGLINRQNNAGNYPLGHSTWSQAITDILELEPEALVGIETTYDDMTREISATVTVDALTDLGNPPYKLAVVLTEDSIVNWQKDYSLAPDEDIPDYVHMHVLRTSLNGTWGTTLGGGSALVAGFSESQTFEMTLDQEYVDHNCNIVAFIYRDDNKGVIQAQYVHLTGN